MRDAWLLSERSELVRDDKELGISDVRMEESVPVKERESYVLYVGDHQRGIGTGW